MEPAMIACAKLFARPSLAARGLLTCCVAALPLVWGVEARAQGGQPIPNLAYFATFPAFYDGDFVAAQLAFQTAEQGAMRSGLAGLWIDSICYETMQGECLFHLGQHAAARFHFEAALRLFLRYNDYFLLVNFPPLIAPAAPGQLTLVPWYVTQRATVLGQYPTQINVSQGSFQGAAAAARFGGVVQTPVLIPVNVQEIVRCTCLALRRWRELLGPACAHHELTKELVTNLNLRPAMPNHWSETWIDVELGLAYAAAGKASTARKYLSSGELVAGQFEHPFTGMALLEIGRLDLAEGNFREAQKNFLEASWSAASYGDYDVVEEALRYAAITHIMSNGRELFPSLAAATAWAATQGMRYLQASLLLSAAENSAVLNAAPAAAALIAQATVVVGQRGMLAGKLGARMNYLRAQTSYQMGDVTTADASLIAALAFLKVGSLWMYHIGIIDIAWLGQDLTDHNALTLFSHVLRDPSQADWAYDPMESLAKLTVPHSLMYEHWFRLVTDKSQKPNLPLALEITDRARRHRFLTSMELGGRLLNLRWVMEAPRHALDKEAMLQRQIILVRYPEYAQRSERARQLRKELDQMPLVAEDEEQAAAQTPKLEELASISVEQESLLHAVALRREACNLVFPPLRDTQTVQDALGEGQALLSFFRTDRALHVFMLKKNKLTTWEIKQRPATVLQKHLTVMLRNWGNWEHNKDLKYETLIDNTWKKPAQALYDSLLKDSKAADPTKSTDELVIVPDGGLWYLPFEALPVHDGERTRPLIEKMRVRYSPTIGLAVGDTRRRKPRENTAVVLGRLFPGQEPEVIDAAYEDLARVVPGAVAVRGKLPAPASVYTSLFDRLIVLGEVVPGEDTYDWSPLVIDRGNQGSKLGQWFPLPFGGPDQVLLPGFRTPAERALKGVPADLAGDDLFFSICGLMANGARTVLISRWRTGGQTSLDLVREFAQELPHTGASDAWQRSVELVSSNPLNVDNEPRVKLSNKQTAPAAQHPFFWAGYLLADTGAKPTTGEEEDEAADEALEKLLAAEAAKAIEAGPVKPPAAGAAMPEDPQMAEEPVANGAGGKKRPRANARAPVRPAGGAAPGGAMDDAGAGGGGLGVAGDSGDDGKGGLGKGGDGSFDDGSANGKSKKKRTRAPRAERKRPPAKSKRSREPA
jgi:CHAT domain-containing protein